jgi:molecular chaperone HtpG
MQKTEEHKQFIDNRSKLEIDNPRLLQCLVERNSEFVPTIYTVSNLVEPILNRISIIFPDYTLHDINHSIRVMEYMYDLIGDISQLSDLDICLLIYSALLHDIGMTATEKEINLIKQDKYLNLDIRYKALLKKYNDNEKLALQEYLRKIHSLRSSEFIKDSLKIYMLFKTQPSLNFYEDLCLICQSHTEDYEWIKNKLKSYNEKAIYKYNAQYCSILLRLADILDIDSNRTPPDLYALINPKGISDDEWKQHFIIFNRNKIKSEDDTRQKSIALYGECFEPDIHRKILKYIEWINYEIYNANISTSKMKKEYQLNLKYPLENKIEPKGYFISDLKLNIDFKAITNLLMGEKIYGDRALGLRELVQNSIDACQVRKEIEDGIREYGEDEYIPIINIILCPKKNQVIIKDNGIGMSFDILKKYFLNIGSSYYRSDDFLLKDYSYTPIGNFGIGFLSCFMLSNDVIIKTRYYNDSTVYLLQLTKESEYICLSQEVDVNFEGTEIILNCSEFMNVMDNKRQKVTNFIQELFLSDVVKIKLIDRDNKFTFENTNKISDLPTCTEKQHIINLSNYIQCAHGYIQVDIKKNLFIKDISDIIKSDNLVYFDGEKLRPIPENFDISLVYSDGLIRYIDVSIIEDSDEYERINDVLEDDEETINKMERDEYLDWVTILIDKKYSNDIKSYNNTARYEEKYIMKGLPTDILKKFGHCIDYPVKVYDKELSLIYGIQLNAILPISSKYIAIKLYLRNVFIKDVRVTIPNIIKGISINEVKINILNNSITTGISRNSINTKYQEKLGYALGKAIHIWVYNNIAQKDSEKLLIKTFIDKFYNQNNDMMNNIEICI